MSLQDLNADTLQTFVEQSSSRPLLLDLWAPWCAPCRAQAPTLSRLADANEEILRVAKLNIDDHKQIAENLKVRSIPTLILFKDGNEVARRTGVQTLQKLQEWLASEGVEVLTTGSAAHSDGDDELLGGAFYGDAELRDFLCGRVLRAASDGRLKGSRFPYWTEGEGTISAAFGHSPNADIFARLTGLPAGFAMCLEAPSIKKGPDIERVFSLLPAGADLRKTPAKYMVQWLDDTVWNWPEFLGAETDALRLAWLSASRDSLQGKAPSKAAWGLLKGQADRLGERDDPLQVVQENFARMLGALTPLPQGTDAQWGRALLLIGTYLVIARAQFEAGWRARDFSMEPIVHSWFVANCPNPRDLSSEEMNALHARMREANSELLAEIEPKKKAFHAAYDELVAPWRDRLMTHLLFAMRPL